MNAYELAYKLNNALGVDYEMLEQSSIMLRQQADRIAELEETIEACYAVQKMQAEEVYKGNDRIAELEKLLEHSVGSDCREMRYIQEIENKDVRIAELEKDLKKYDQLAWDDLNKSKTIWCNCGDSIAADSGAKCGICASTTPQTKPLSDEEIIKIFNQIWNDGGNTNGLMHRFARAIEERHGIK